MREEKIFEWQSKGFDATSAIPKSRQDGQPFVAVVNYSEDHDLDAVVQEIRMHLINGRAVAVRPIKPSESYEWTKKFISKLTSGYGDDLTTRLTWQSKHSLMTEYVTSS